MKLFLPLFLASLTAVGHATGTDFATQTFFIPMPEAMLMDNSFEKINSVADGQVNTMISLTVSIDDTVVVYDHWEDGYEPTGTKTQSTTEVWGDGDASNGCAPTPKPCTDANDVLKAGDAIIIQDRMVVSPRSPSEIHFDGGDRVLSTKPVAITRGAFPDNPGSLMAGAVEVLDTFGWGTEFEAPVGTDADIWTQAFQYVALYVQASTDGTEVKVNGNKVATLDMGQSHAILYVKQAWKITTSKPVQVNLITGDIGSTYEMRWFALLPTKDWSNSYLSPVGDTMGGTRLVIYNPGSSSLSVTYKTLQYTKTANVPSKRFVMSDVIPDGSGCLLDGSQNFLVLSVTDTVRSGQIYDWGFPVIPRSKLSTQVLVGLGFGCTNNDCQGGSERSVVWVSPIEDADVYIDFDNDGNVDKTFQANYLSSTIITDTHVRDHDMSGAIIYATKRGTGETGPPVKIASAWGQNPAFSTSAQQLELDLGTVVLPYDPLRVTEHCEVMIDANGDGKVSAGDTVEITMKVMNAGQVDLPKGYWVAGQPSLAQMSYVPGTAKCTDADTGAVYDLADNGSSLPAFTSQATLKRRGGVHNFSFRAKIDTNAQLPEGFCDVLNVVQGELTVGLEITPTEAPTSGPTGGPTKAPTKAPTFAPTEAYRIDGCPVPAKPKRVIKYGSP